MKAATTKRYYVKGSEVEIALELDGKIESIHKITPYEHDQETELKGMDYIITTVIDIEEQVEKEGTQVTTRNPDYLNRHLSN